MIVSHKHKFIFLKTRKTAGSTLEKILYPYLGEFDVCTGSERDETPRLNTDNKNGHLNWHQIENLYPTEWKNYYKFTIERNPWDKVVSSYFWHQTIKKERFGAMSFEEYVETCELLPIDWTKYASKRNVMVDNIWLYENMSDMYSELNDMFGFNITEDDWKNTRLKSGIRKVQSYKEMHNSNTIEKVRLLFKNEINHLGYFYD
jgi:hypothetical protein